MAKFTVRPEVLKNCGVCIRSISDDTLVHIIALLDSVKNGIDRVSPDLIQTMDALIERTRRNKVRVAGLGQAADEIGRFYELAELNIVNHSGAVRDTGTSNGNADDTPDEDLNHHGKEEPSFWDNVKLFADLFSMSFWETLHLFGDIMQLLGAGGWEAITGWKDGYDWKEWFYQYVPNHVDDKTLLIIMTMLSSHSLPQEVSEQHLNSNIEAWKDYLSAHPNDFYIEHQGDMGGVKDDAGNVKAEIKYGNHTADYNACEVIAVYNALLAMHGGDSPQSFPALLYTFEQGGICAGGEFGTTPVALYVYFEKRGYDVKMLSGGKINAAKLGTMQEKYDTYILTTYNNADNVGDMVHTVSITAETIDGETKYQIHNASDTKTYDSLAEAVEGYNDGNGEPISVIGVR